MSALRRTRLDREVPMSIPELAEKSGVSDDQIRNIEDGKVRKPRFTTLVALAEALGVTPAQIDPLVNGDVREAEANR